MKPKYVGTLEAKTNLSSLLSQVEEGAAFYITKHGKPVAELKPFIKETKPTKVGFGKGLFHSMSDDFDEPLEDFKEYME